MAKRVVVLASGRTEFAALPHLARSFQDSETTSFEVRIPPGGGVLVPAGLEKLIKATWWELTGRGEAPDKLVILIDADGHPEAERESLFKQVCARFADIPIPILVTSAQWHLEAWFFADSETLRSYLGRDLGSIDASFPDQIQNPKLHLTHLLEFPYTARIAGEIAAKVRPDIVRDKSPSFARYDACLRNGDK